MKHLLVTGGAGFIGSQFIWHMLETYPEYTVINLDKLTYAGNLDTVQKAQAAFGNRYTFVQGDICDEILVNSLMPRVDMIVHFAAESHVDMSITNPDIFLQTNVMGTHTLLKAALSNGNKRFHHVSTDEVFGSLTLDGGKFNENTAYDPRSPYSASKASSDHLVSAYFHTYGLPVTISNCSNNYGPFQFPEKIIPLFILRAMQNQPLPIYGDGKSVRDYLFVEDHCKAIDLILHKGVIGETYCIGGGSEKNGEEIANTILKILHKSDSMKEYVTDRLGHDRRYAIDHSKITEALGWVPQVSFEEGIKQTIKWYQDNESWWKKLT